MNWSDSLLPPVLPKCHRLSTQPLEFQFCAFFATTSSSELTRAHPFSNVDEDVASDDPCQLVERRPSRQLGLIVIALKGK